MRRVFSCHESWRRARINLRPGGSYDESEESGNKYFLLVTTVWLLVGLEMCVLMSWPAANLCNNLSSSLFIIKYTKSFGNTEYLCTSERLKLQTHYGRSEEARCCGLCLWGPRGCWRHHGLCQEEVNRWSVATAAQLCLADCLLILSSIWYSLQIYIFDPCNFLD